MLTIVAAARGHRVQGAGCRVLTIVAAARGLPRGRRAEGRGAPLGSPGSLYPVPCAPLGSPGSHRRPLSLARGAPVDDARGSTGWRATVAAGGCGIRRRGAAEQPIVAAAAAAAAPSCPTPTSTDAMPPVPAMLAVGFAPLGSTLQPLGP